MTTAIPTGSPKLDQALGIGGWPRGRVVEIFGRQGSGRTTLALQAIAQVQAADYVCAYIDLEHALNIFQARALGVNPEHLLVSQPDCAEQALEIADKLVATGAVDLVVLDSLTAFLSRTELAGELTEEHLGLQARAMSRAMRKLVETCGRNNACVLVINETRQGPEAWKDPRPLTRAVCSNALRFYAAVRVELKRVAGKVHAYVQKNKVAAPFGDCEL